MSKHREWPPRRWPDVDPRFRIQPRHLFGPFYSLRVFDTQADTEVIVTNGSFLTGRSSVRRAAKYSTARYLRFGGRHEAAQRRRPGWGAPDAPNDTPLAA